MLNAFVWHITLYFYLKTVAGDGFDLCSLLPLAHHSCPLANSTIAAVKRGNVDIKYVTTKP